MKFGFVGAQCSGKTTTAHSVYAKLKELEYNNVALVTERARECPYSIADSYSLFKTEHWILLNQMLAEEALEDKWDYIICDRSVIDEIIYYDYARREAAKKTKIIKEFYSMASKLNFLVDVANAWVKIRPYTQVFLFRPLPFVEDADRIFNVSWQQGIDALFMKYCEGKEGITIVDQEIKKERTAFVLKKVLGYMNE
jgi:hypothetical protein